MPSWLLLYLAHWITTTRPRMAMTTPPTVDQVPFYCCWSGLVWSGCSRTAAVETPLEGPLCSTLARSIWHYIVECYSHIFISHGFVLFESILGPLRTKQTNPARLWIKYRITPWKHTNMDRELGTTSGGGRNNILHPQTEPDPWGSSAQILFFPCPNRKFVGGGATHKIFDMISQTVV